MLFTSESWACAQFQRRCGPIGPFSVLRGVGRRRPLIAATPRTLSSASVPSSRGARAASRAAVTAYTGLVTSTRNSSSPPGEASAVRRTWYSRLKWESSTHTGGPSRSGGKRTLSR
jgi:hypothetical protein